MTAPDQPTRRELLRDLTHEAIDNGSYGEPAPEHAHKPSEQANEQAASPAATGSSLAETETAPVERRPSDQRREPLAGSTPIMPAPSDLRDRIRGIFHTINPNCVDYHATDCTDCTARADAVMAVVQPVLDAKDAEIARLRRNISASHQHLNEIATERDAAIERAEAAEAEAAKQAADADRLDQLLIDERAITARLGRELAALRALHQQIGDQP